MKRLGPWQDIAAVLAARLLLLRRFCVAMFRPSHRPPMKRSRLWQDIALVLAAKMVLLTCLYFAFFSPSHRPPADTAAVTARLLDQGHR